MIEIHSLKKKKKMMMMMQSKTRSYMHVMKRVMMQRGGVVNDYEVN